MEEAINEIIYLYWINQIDGAKMRQMLADVPSDVLASWIDGIINRTDAMKLVTGNCRMKYQKEKSPMPERSMDERITEAARYFCYGESVRYWRNDSTFRAVQDGFCMTYEYYTFEKRARELQKQLHNPK